MTIERVASALVATDLDRTMIYSRSSMGERRDLDLDCVEFLDGAPQSFMTATAASALRELAAEAHVVPATTRTIAQFRRVRLPGGPWRYAVTSNGGNLLVDGRPDPQWRAAVGAVLRTEAASLDEVSAALHTRIDDQWVTAMRVADDLFCYLVVDPRAVPADFAAEWGHWCARRGWNVSRQGRKIYTMPNAVCKSRAVGEVRSRLSAAGELTPDARVLAAGDGLLDAELLASATMAIRPRHGELQTLGWTHPTVTVTESAGSVAAEEILTWLGQRLAD